MIRQELALKGERELRPFRSICFYCVEVKSCDGRFAYLQLTITFLRVDDEAGAVANIDIEPFARKHGCARLFQVLIE